jgi:hypothetical protein
VERRIEAKLGEDRDGTPDAASRPIPHARYGFKKASHHVTVEAYDEWDRKFSEHLDRRRKKWHALMKSYGLGTETT